MSDYCKTCRYDPKKRTGEGACPYNALYWNFFLEHDKDLRGNHRLGLTYRNVDKLSDDDKKQLQQQARKHFDAVGISDAYQSG